MLEMETDQAANEALAWLERVYQHGVSGCECHQSCMTTLSAQQLGCCNAVLLLSPPRFLDPVPAPCMPCCPSCPEIHSQGFSFQLLQGRDQAGGPHGAGSAEGARIPAAWRSAANLFGFHRMHRTLNQCVMYCLQLPVVNLVTASCKAVFGNSNSNSISRTSSGAQLDPGASASYLYYMCVCRAKALIVPGTRCKHTATRVRMQPCRAASILLGPGHTQQANTLTQSVVCHMCVRVCRVAEGLLQQLFPRDAQQPPAAGEGGSQRFKGMVKVTNPPECTALVSCQEFHLPLIECALTLVHHIISSSTTPQQARCCSGWAAAGLLAVGSLAPRRQMQASMHSTHAQPGSLMHTHKHTMCFLVPCSKGP